MPVITIFLVITKALRGREGSRGWAGGTTYAPARPNSD
jgi:hypothetical protein